MLHARAEAQPRVLLTQGRDGIIAGEWPCLYIAGIPVFFLTFYDDVVNGPI